MPADRMTTEATMLAAAERLLEASGLEAVTTRAVCAAAGVTAPTLYHHFGDKDGLLAALVERGVREFMARKRGANSAAAPLSDLRQGWDAWIDFALERPALFRLMVEQAKYNPAPQNQAYDLMRARVQRADAAGLFRVDAETAARAIWAASNGVMSLMFARYPKSAIVQTAGLLFDAVLAYIARADAAPTCRIAEKHKR